MRMVSDFMVIWICGALVQLTSVMVPTIEYTLVSEKSGGTGAGEGSVFGVADTVEAGNGFASGSVLRSIRGPGSEGGFDGALPMEAGAAEECGLDILATSSPALSAVARSLADS